MQELDIDISESPQYFRECDPLLTLRVHNVHPRPKVLGCEIWSVSVKPLFAGKVVSIDSNRWLVLRFNESSLPTKARLIGLATTQGHLHLHLHSKPPSLQPWQAVEPWQAFWAWCASSPDMTVIENEFRLTLEMRASVLIGLVCLLNTFYTSPTKYWGNNREEILRVFAPQNFTWTTR